MSFDPNHMSSKEICACCGQHLFEHKPSHDPSAGGFGAYRACVPMIGKRNPHGGLLPYRFVAWGTGGSNTSPSFQHFQDAADRMNRGTLGVNYWLDQTGKNTGVFFQSHEIMYDEMCGACGQHVFEHEPVVLDPKTGAISRVCLATAYRGTNNKFRPWQLDLKQPSTFPDKKLVMDAAKRMSTGGAFWMTNNPSTFAAKPSTAAPECKCKSLLGGHEPDCRYPRKSWGLSL